MQDSLFRLGTKWSISYIFYSHFWHVVKHSAGSLFSLPLRKIILSEWCSREMSVFMHCEIEIGHITQAFQHSVQPPEIRLWVKAQKLGCCLLWSLLISVGRCSYVCLTFSVRTFLLILTTSKVCVKVKNWDLYSVCYNQDPSKLFPEIWSPTINHGAVAVKIPFNWRKPSAGPVRWEAGEAGGGNPPAGGQLGESKQGGGKKGQKKRLLYIIHANTWVMLKAQNKK